MKLTVNILAYQIWILNHPFMAWRDAKEEAGFWFYYKQSNNPKPKTICEDGAL